MSFAVELLPIADHEAKEATKYYELRVPGLGARFRLAVERALAAVSRQPLLWNKRLGNYRRINISGFPYFIAYLIRGERIIILAVGHASRHPDYWKRRLPGS